VIVHLVDGTYEIFRQYYAPRPGHLDTDGIEVGATRGVVQSVFTMLQDGATIGYWSRASPRQNGGVARATERQRPSRHVGGFARSSSVMPIPMERCRRRNERGGPIN
jgi:hypothetical protein